MPRSKLVDLDYFFLPKPFVKRVFNTTWSNSGWNLGLRSRGYTRSRVTPWYEQNLYTDLDRSYDSVDHHYMSTGEKIGMGLDHTVRFYLALGHRTRDALYLDDVEEAIVGQKTWPGGIRWFV